MKVRAHILISGRVQGVFFRMEIRDEASKRNVSGWVRNISGRRVEAIFEGKKENVENLIKFCNIGPPRAKVTKVNVQWEEYKGEFKDFKIRETLIF
jgi:acylphosphatase